ncbi:MBL fold metallo-hydrolase [Ciceribacter naphthalenivorans]|uniref:MBL fold metallo-hydrolase n=3 Tax=Alphaproteobacteria TaxID=28211 RepID=A0A512HIF8_9HYPH|nr:MBL fold metallo-hydrolase [Sphingomonas psychrolutea]GEO85170.1 MBL fold metallo-hydrolase [Ciceribacter naphthalenivorans]GLR24496.1 MBL fold metallo-hydrolase [Ciceribacter naphthalenivorans]GLT07352.1 MBL fold metallo-hydrolase [Sphingomonas psychrolutea]
MVEINRRVLLGGAGLALASPLIMTRAAVAQAADSAMDIDHAMPPETHRFKVGNFEVVVVKDGARASGKPQAIFGIDQTPDAVGELLQANFLPPDNFVNSFAPVLVNTGSDVILFDTGMGEGGRANGLGRLVEGLTAAGYTREDVSIVVLTHMHGDHIGGLMEGGQPAFPNARYVTGQVEYDFWVDPARAGTPAEGGHKGVLAKVKPLADKMTFIVDGGDVVSGITGMAAFGHSPGHMIYRLESEGRQLVLAADTANHFVLSLQKPEWEVKFDMDKTAAAATRRRVFDMISTDRLAFLGYHMPFPAVGYVEKVDTGYRYVPKSYQFDI